MQTYTAVGVAPTKARETFRHRVAIIGGGTAGITVAAQLARQGIHDVALIEPSPKHYYQPLWTLVGAGGRAFWVGVRSAICGRADGVGHFVGGGGCGDGLADGQGV
jgi:NADPH-dependent 2,4-dienoyl-CoA reductase/sulfur reductase-like enzyme